MKAKEVLNTLKISRGTLYNYVKQGLIGVEEQHNGYYDYNKDDVYSLLNKGVKRKTYIYENTKNNTFENQIFILKTWCFNYEYKIDGIYSDIPFKTQEGLLNLLDEIMNYRVKYVIVTNENSFKCFKILKHLFAHFGTEIIQTESTYD